jgi:presenilin-like A22 family membrane protease
MKHELRITLFLIALFLLSQLVGLFILKETLVENVGEQGERVVAFDQAKVGEVPRVSGLQFLIFVVIGISLGTAIVLLLARFRKVKLWKAWFAVAVFIAINFALKTFLNQGLAMALALALTIWKLYKPNVVVHNLSEVLMYSGIAVFLVPLLNSVQNKSVLGLPGNIFWASLILVAISVYDFIAVFKSKHMVSMAKFQAQSKVFAGLFIPYHEKAQPGPAAGRQFSYKSVKVLVAGGKKVVAGTKQVLEERQAILGGGDIAFPLIFSGTVLFHKAGIISVHAAFVQTLVISLSTTIALALLFFFAQKGKFYPAMPIVSAGCFAGYFLTLLL